MKENCGNCKFYAYWALECRRHAPIVVPLEKHGKTMYPDTTEFSWCGDWEEKEQENNDQRNQTLE